MRVLITGGAGFIGKKLARALLDRGELMGRRIERLVLLDIVAAEGMGADPRLDVRTGEITRRGAVSALVSEGFDAIFHLAAVVSAAAEADFDLGMSVNLDGTLHLLEAARHAGGRPRLVFASSLATFGGELPDPVEDWTHLNPQSSYGTEKAIGELLVADYGRKGFIDGRSLRLPTIVVRPGRPNKAASSFASSILREPLNGEEAICPVGSDTAMYILSPRGVVAAFIKGMELDEETFQGSRSLTLPGITVSVAEMLEALRDVAGARVAERVRFEPDPLIERIVRSWPPRFTSERALRLGFEADRDIASIIRQHVEDERGGAIAR